MGKKLRKRFFHWATHLHGIPGHVDDTRKWREWVATAARVLVFIPEWLLWIGGTVFAISAFVTARGFLALVKQNRAEEIAKHEGRKLESSRFRPEPHPITGGPPVGWMRYYEGERLAVDYTPPIKEMTRDEAAGLLVEEFAERHPQHFDERRRYIERIPLTAWLLKHNIPMPYRWRWRRKALGLVYDDDGAAYFVPSEKRRPLREDE